jgi:hypothetical protein
MKHKSLLALATGLMLSLAHVSAEAQVVVTPQDYIDATGLALGDVTIPSGSGLVLPSGVPSVTTNKLYNNSGTLTFDGTPVGGVTIGTLNAIPKFGAADLADSSITDNGTTVDMTTAGLAFTASGTVTSDAGFNFVPNAATSGHFFFDNDQDAGYIVFPNGEVATYQANLALIFTVPDVAGGSLSVLNMQSVTFADQTSGSVAAIELPPAPNDPDSTDTGIEIPTGWDYAISILGDGSATDDNITLGASRTADAQIYWSGSALTFDVDGTATNDVTFGLGNSPNAFVRFHNTTLNNYMYWIPGNSATNGFDFFELEIAGIAATDGSDEVNMLLLDWNETDWATATETLNAIKIDGITQDAQGTYNAISIGASWDNGIRFVGTPTNSFFWEGSAAVLSFGKEAPPWTSRLKPQAEISSSIPPTTKRRSN